MATIVVPKFGATVVEAHDNELSSVARTPNADTVSFDNVVAGRAKEQVRRDDDTAGRVVDGVEKDQSAGKKQMSRHGALQDVGDATAGLIDQVEIGAGANVDRVVVVPEPKATTGHGVPGVPNDGGAFGRAFNKVGAPKVGAEKRLIELIKDGAVVKQCEIQVLLAKYMFDRSSLLSTKEGGHFSQSTLSYVRVRVKGAQLPARRRNSSARRTAADVFYEAVRRKRPALPRPKIEVGTKARIREQRSNEATIVTVSLAEANDGELGAVRRSVPECARELGGAWEELKANAGRNVGR